VEKPNVLNSKAVKKFVKGSFVIFGLLVVLSYGFVTTLLFKKSEANVNILVGIFVVIQVLTFFGFLGLIIWNYNKLCVVSSVKDEDALRKKIKMDILSDVYLLVTEAMKSNDEKTVKTLTELLKKIS